MNDERPRPVQLLVVCTANQCRSPMAEVLLAQHLDDVGVAAVVRSSGRLGDGTPVDRFAVAAMRERVLDLAGRRSRPLVESDVSAADLVITMERAHVLDVAQLDMASWARTFTLPELLRRALRVGQRGAGEPLSEWVRRVHDGRDAAAMIDGDTSDDIADPIGGSITDFRTCASIIDRYLEQLVALAFDPLRS